MPHLLNLAVRFHESPRGKVCFNARSRAMTRTIWQKGKWLIRFKCDIVHICPHVSPSTSLSLDGCGFSGLSGGLSSGLVQCPKGPAVQIPCGSVLSGKAQIWKLPHKCSPFTFSCCPDGRTRSVRRAREVFHPACRGHQESCCAEGHGFEWEARGKTFIFAAAAAEAAAP